jgi:hypothetical protein
MNSKLEEWISTVAADGGVEADSLHINQLDPVLQDRQAWKDGAIELLLTAGTLRDLHDWPVEIAAGMSLEATPPSVGLEAATLEDLFGLGDWSPPNLYVFAKGSEPWAETSILRDTVEYVNNASLRVVVGEWFDEWEGANRGAFWVTVNRR